MTPEDKQKISEFVTHLLSNPNIKAEPILIGENLIINFITKNLNQLKETFKTPQFFPNIEWETVLQQILIELRERVLNAVVPEITDYINTSINFAVLNKVSESDSIGAEFFKEKFLGFVKTIMIHKDVRYNFNSVINIFKYKVLERYIPDIFERREFLYNELVKVQKNNLKPEEYINYLKILLLIKNSAYIRLPFETKAGAKKVNINEFKKVPKLIEVFVTKLIETLKKELTGVSEKVIKMALKSNIREEYTQLEEASARFLYILTARFQDYKPYVKIDRGAETPDKSWFNIARKNAEYYGYSKRMLEELYRIAGDNNW